MDRLERLERGWLLYKLRWLFKHTILIIVSLAVGGLVVYWLDSAPPREVPDEEAALQLSAQKTDQSATPEPRKVVQEVVVAPEPVFLKPDFGFEQDIARRLGARASRQQPTAPAKPRVVVSRSVDLPELEARFGQNPTYDQAVEIARAHLRAGDAQKALDWSLKANEINNEDARSWAVFATASAQLGRQEQAASSLRAYLRTRPSERLSNLLAELEQ
jgi:tetratricopeptide (TPR) repeat protein